MTNRRTRPIAPFAVLPGVWAVLWPLATALAILVVGCMLLAAVLTYFGSSSDPAVSSETQICDASAFMTLVRVVDRQDNPVTDARLTVTNPRTGQSVDLSNDAYIAAPPVDPNSLPHDFTADYHDSPIPPLPEPPPPPYLPGTLGDPSVYVVYPVEGADTGKQEDERVLVTVQHGTAAVQKEFVFGFDRCHGPYKISGPDTIVLPE
jgi:hypothetical protein